MIGQPDVSFTALNESQAVAVAGDAAGFTGLLSLFNIGGRFFWASLSDGIGRKRPITHSSRWAFSWYASAPWAAHAGSRGLFRARDLHHPFDVWRPASPPLRAMIPGVDRRSRIAADESLPTAWCERGISRNGGEPPPYIERMMRSLSTNSPLDPACAAQGADAYRGMPSAKNV